MSVVATLLRGFKDRETEAAFRDDFAIGDVANIRNVMLFVALVFYAFFLWDSIIDPSNADVTHLIRGVVSLSIAGAAFLASWQKDAGVRRTPRHERYDTCCSRTFGDLLYSARRIRVWGGGSHHSDALHIRACSGSFSLPIGLFGDVAGFVCRIPVSPPSFSCPRRRELNLIGLCNIVRTRERGLERKRGQR